MLHFLYAAVKKWNPLTCNTNKIERSQRVEYIVLDLKRASLFYAFTKKKKKNQWVKLPWYNKVLHKL